MSNPKIRGLVIFVVGVIVSWFACVFLPYVWMPSLGLSIALPVITVPGEIVHTNWIGDYDLTNTFLGGLLASFLVLLWVGLNYRNTKGWTREVPDRWQAWTEIFIEVFYNFCDGIGGERFRKAPILWPFVAGIFIFLLAGNMGKLFPGFESIGYIHCSHVGISGYARVQGWGETWRLWVDRPLFVGISQTEETEHECVDALKVSDTYHSDYNPDDYAEERDAYYARLAAIGAENIPDEFHEESTARRDPTFHLMSNTEQVEQDDHGQAEEDDHGDDDHSDFVNVPTTGSCLASESGETASPDEVRIAFMELEEAEKAHKAHKITDRDLEQRRCHVTRMIHLGAIFPMSAEQLQENKIQPYIFAITPFLRGVATDLSFNFGLAILSIVAVQVYGVLALGPSYFEKFINVTGLGNANKKPLGLIDFGVGLIELISEIGKIVSLAFRLFGNIFAGGIVLIIFSFLLAFAVPGVLFALEIIIGLAQAMVFSVLTLVFSVQAMESHHDDHDDDEHH